ncbi:MAG: TetR/AcrR family transcriptional regulator [Ignavibacteria bacterium]
MARTKSAPENREAKRVLIVETAIGIFASKGYHAAKMQDIADALSIAKGTLYEYYTDKEDLFLGVYDYWMDLYEASMMRAMEDHFDPVSKADALIDTTVEFYEKHAKYAPLLLEFWAHALRSTSDSFLIRIRDMKKRLSQLGSEVATQMQALKLFRNVDSESFAVLELGISDGIFLQWVIDGQSYSLREAYKFRQSVIGSGLMTDTLRKLVAGKVEKKLRLGFLHTSFVRKEDT